MQILLYPQHVSFSTFVFYSPRLFGYLKEKGVSIEYKSWDGTADSLPTIPSIVRGSPKVKCDWEIFVRKCHELGHFVFYGDDVVMPDGLGSHFELIPRLKEFLTKHSFITM